MTMSAPPNLDDLDAIVCGGGPAGSTFATVLARAGRRVALFEREKFPRFHIGESLLPWNVPLLERIGALHKVRTEGMQVKYGARFYHQGTERTRPVRFADGMDRNHPSAFQVKRGDFDKLLLDHARESGALVFEESKIEDVLWQGAVGGRARGVRVRLPGESAPREVTARFVADATGRDALLARALGGRRRDPQLDRSAAFAHFDTFNRAEGPTGGDIIVITTPDGWWWMIPFSDGTVSVGIVMPSKRFKERTGSVEDLFNASIANAPEVRAHLGPGRRTTEVYAIADYSYCAETIVGDGFCLIGDAACFLDPVFSTGVLLAMTAGEMAGAQVDGALIGQGARGCVGPATLRKGVPARRVPVPPLRPWVLRAPLPRDVLCPRAEQEPDRRGHDPARRRGLRAGPAHESVAVPLLLLRRVDARAALPARPEGVRARDGDHRGGGIGGGIVISINP